VKRGFALAEILIGSFVVLVVSVCFFTVFSNSYRYAAHSRNRAVAIVLGRGLLEEVEAHPYGSPVPVRWQREKETPAQIWVEGRPVPMVFHKKISFRNGSFIGQSKGNEDSDIVTIVLSWKEGEGTAAPNAAGDNQQMRLTVPVWR
jgi:hypothetical protein